MIDTTSQIKEKLNNLPLSPGIYKFIDSNGRIIYVGKSKLLRNRVRSYFRENPEWHKVREMVPHINDIEIIETDTHLEARLLECELIKSIKPMFNTMMKNDERYVYIKIEEFNRYHPISIVYRREENSFGPFRSKSSIYELIKLMSNLYPIEISNGEYKIDYHLMPISMDRTAFDKNKEILMGIFSDDIQLSKFISTLEANMKEAACLHRFETASMYRNIIFSLNYLKSGFNGHKIMFTQKIVLKIPISNGVKLFFIYQGQILYKRCYKRLSKKSWDLFIQKGANCLKPSNSHYNEKSRIDYRDILYSELLSLPDNMITIT